MKPYELPNRLHEAREKGRVLGDAKVEVPAGLRPANPQVSLGPTNPKLVMSPVRQMGSTTISQRRSREYGSRNVWGGTPLEDDAASLGDPEIFDVGDVLKEWARVGWYWDREKNRLCVYLTDRDGRTYVVNIPWAQVKRLLNRHCGERITEPTLNGFFKKIGRGLKKVSKGPANFVKNPRKFMRDGARALKTVVRKVGKTAVNVAGHPVFAGISSALAVVPPLQAVGGAGLAAYAAARAAKPAIDAADKALSGAEKALTKKGKRIDPKKALAAARNTKANMKKLPPGMRKMFGAALASSPASPSRRKFRLRKKRK